MYKLSLKISEELILTSLFLGLFGGDRKVEFFYIGNKAGSLTNKMNHLITPLHRNPQVSLLALVDSICQAILAFYT